MRKAVLTLTTLLFVIGTIGSNIGPALVDENPRLVLLLSSRNRNLFGSVPYIDLTSYIAIGFPRVLIAGELPAIYRWTENAVEKAGSVALVLMPGSNIVCLLLGHKRMDPRRFVPLLSLGIAIKLAVLWRGGQIFAEEIKSFLNWIEKYQWYVVMALFALSMLQSVRKGRPQQK
jgi:hypothetical protein